MLGTGSGNGKSVVDRLNDMEKNIEDWRCQSDLAFDEKLGKKMNALEADLKKICTRDMQRVDTELLILNTNFSTLSTEHRNLEEKFKRELSNSFEAPRRSDVEIQSQIGLQVDTMVKSHLGKLGLNGQDAQKFKESIQNIISDGNPQYMISHGNKEIQHQTLEMVSKLSKDVFYEID